MTEQERKAAISKCVLIGDDTRLRIVDYLATPDGPREVERAVFEIVKAVGLKQTTVSGQLGRLRLGGFVQSERRGKCQMYRLTPLGLRVIPLVRTLIAGGA